MGPPAQNHLEMALAGFAQTLYEMLGVPEDASTLDITQAYEEKSENTSDQRFYELSAAFQVRYSACDVHILQHTHTPTHH